MRLTLLGNSGAVPNPGQGCSSYLVSFEGTNLLLDCGPDTISELRRHTRLQDISAVAISHLHSDHTVDLVPFRYGLRYGPERPAAPIPLWIPPGGPAFLQRLGQVFALGKEGQEPFFAQEFAIEEYDPAAPLTLGPFSIRFHPTKHFIDCWAMRIEAGGRTLVYLADTGPYPALERFAEGADLLICEANLPESAAGTPENEGHLTAMQAGNIATSAGVRQMVLTHMWFEFGIDRQVELAARTFSGSIIPAAAGIKIEI